MSESVGVEPGRLNGWKEISGHLGKGARTVQRWEKLYGLPVHRIGREGGEIVYAYRDEIDRWLRLTAQQRAGPEGETPETLRDEPPTNGAASERVTPAPRRVVRRWLVPVVLLAGASAALLLAPRMRPTAKAGDATRRSPEAFSQPAAWRLANESLTVFDAAGTLLFEHRFGSPLIAPVSSESPLGSHGPLPVLIADADGDGRNEVLVNLNASDRAQRKLYCFEADGTVRFSHQPTGTHRFGDDVYGEPWLAHRVFVTRGPDGRRRLWATFTHNLLFPAVLRELDPRDGTVRQEYWSNGFIETVHEGTWAGRAVVLVGGTNNDFRSASLAVFPPDAVAGSTPAVRPGYDCRDCAPGGPGALFLFPTLCIARRGGQATVAETWVEKGDHLRVSVSQGNRSLGEAVVYYTLGPGGTVLGAEISPEFQVQHSALEREGSLDHPFGPRDDREVFPVRSWDGGRFVELPRVPVRH